MKNTPLAFNIVAVLMLYAQHASVWAANIQMPGLSIDTAHSILGLPTRYDEQKSYFIAYLQSRDVKGKLTPNNIEIWHEAERRNLTNPTKAEKCIGAMPSAVNAMAKSKILESALNILKQHGIGLNSSTEDVRNQIRLALTNEMAVQEKLKDGKRAIDATISFVDACLNPWVSPIYNTGFVQAGFIPYVEPKEASIEGNEATTPNKVTIDRAKRLPPRPIKYESVLTK